MWPGVVPRHMTRSELEAASRALHDASRATTDDATATRLDEQAEQLARLAERDAGPDHGRLARHQHVLSDILEDADETVREHVETAKEHISAYRETVEGV